MPAATEYRRQSPASPHVTPSVPQAPPETVFDITYYKRDARHPLQDQAAGKPQTKGAEAPACKPKGWEPPTPGKPYKWDKRRPLLDYENGGYT